jgi:DNA polymerase-3 subunit delta
VTAVKAGDVDRAVRGRGRDVSVLLFFGPDTGHVSERAKQAAHAAVDDPDDPFQLVRLDGDGLADDPMRLVEEASTYGLFGSRRALWVRATSRNITPALSACLDVALTDVLLVVEAGELPRTSPLRLLCERSPRALALPCYLDETRDLGRVVTDTLRAQGLSIGADAQRLLVDALGGDRLATRSELDKLILYAHGRREITVEDVEQVVSDVSALALDRVVDLAFAGDLGPLDDELGRMLSAGSAAGGILPAAIRHALALMGSVARMEAGETSEGALRAWRGLHFARRDAVARQLRRWSSDALVEALRRLQDAVMDTRRSPALTPTLISRALLGIARSARQHA